MGKLENSKNPFVINGGISVLKQQGKVINDVLADAEDASNELHLKKLFGQPILEEDLEKLIEAIGKSTKLLKKHVDDAKKVAGQLGVDTDNINGLDL